MARSDVPAGHASSVPGASGSLEAYPTRTWLVRELAALSALIALPALVYYLWLCVSDPEASGTLFLPTLDDLGRIPQPTWTSVIMFGVWITVQAALYLLLPGEWVRGVRLEDGSRVSYRLNGVWAVPASLLFCSMFGYFPFSPNPGRFILAEFGPLLTTATLFSFGMSLWLYIWGRWRGQREDGPFHGYFAGLTLNPGIGHFDLKFFLESRPGLIAWLLFDLCLLFEQSVQNQRPTSAMMLVVAFQGFYVVDYFVNEEKILSTWDIKHEKLGWMLIWGCVVWVPFVFSLQAQYLVKHPVELPEWAIGGIVALNVAGYLIFRLSNSQKHQFRQDPKVPIWGKPPEYIATAQGSLLVTSGWWGLARHINYLGDLMMALAWCLPCGFGSPLPYFYFVYFVILLVHRERRDNAACKAKYGADWDAYCRKVPWRIVPYVY